MYLYFLLVFFVRSTVWLFLLLFLLLICMYMTIHIQSTHRLLSHLFCSRAKLFSHVNAWYCLSGERNCRPDYTHAYRRGTGEVQRERKGPLGESSATRVHSKNATDCRSIDAIRFCTPYVMLAVQTNPQACMQTTRLPDGILIFGFPPTS